MKKVESDQKPSQLLIIANSLNSEHLTSLLTSKFPNSQDNAHLKIENKYFSSKIQISQKSLDSWRSIELISYEVILILADQSSSSELSEAASIAKALDPLDPEVKIVFFNNLKETEVDLEAFLAKAETFIEMVDGNLTDFEWSEDSKSRYESVSEENEGVLRIFEALENCMWQNKTMKNSKEDENKELKELVKTVQEIPKAKPEEKDLKEKTKPKTPEEEEDEFEKEMEGVESIFQQMAGFKQARDQLPDAERRKKAAELVMKLASSMEMGEEFNLADLGF